MQDFCCWWENCLATPTLLPTQDMGGGGGGGGVSTVNMSLESGHTQFSFFIKLVWKNSTPSWPPQYSLTDP